MNGPQVQHQFMGILDAALRAEVDRVSRMTDEAFRGRCAWCSPESTPGACDGGHPCQSLAAVHDLEADQPYCLSHFYNRGGAR